MLDPAIIGQILWSSFANSSYFVLFALAFALVLKVNGVFNFAQGGVMTAAFYAAYTIVGTAKGPGWLGFIGGLAAAVVLGIAIEVTGFRNLRLRRASPLFVFIFTLVLTELIAYIAMLIFGTWPTTIFPSLYWPVTLVGGIAISEWDVPAVLSAATACIALFLFLRFTRSGQCMIAVADNSELAELYGIERNAIYVHTMAVAGLMVGLGMFLFGARAQVQPSTSIELMLFAVVASIAGGIGNLWGAALTAVVLGIIQNGSVLVLPSEWQGLLLYIFLFVAIIFFPSGIKLPTRKLKVSRRATELDGESRET